MSSARHRPSASTQSVEHRRSPRWGRRVFVLFVLLAGVVYSAPIIVSRTELRQRLVPLFLPDMAATVELGEANLNWLSPVRLDGVSLRDSAGELLFEAEGVESERSLLSMLFGFHDIGVITLRQPRLSVTLTGRGTNLDELIRSLSDEGEESDDDGLSIPVAFGIEILDGTIRVLDEMSGESCELDQLSARVRIPRPSTGPIEVQLSTDAIYQQRQGSISGEFAWNHPEQLSAADLGQGELRFEARGFPLAVLTSAFRHSHLDIILSGALNGNVVCHWTRNDAGPELTAEGQLTAADVQLAIPSKLGADIVRSERITLGIDATVREQQFHVRAVEAACEYGHVTLSGQIPLSELFATELVNKLASHRSQHQLAVAAKLDLKQWAAALPETLRLRSDTSLSGGSVALELNSEAANSNNRRIHGRVTTENLVADSGGKKITWKNPMQLDFAVQSNAAGYEIDTFACRSDFLRADASGTLAAGSIRATGDLDQLAKQLDQFFDLGSTRLAGQLSADGQWSTAADATYSANLRAVVQDFLLVYSETPPWQERQLDLVLTAQGRAHGATVANIQSLEARLESGDDRMVARLVEPVDQVSRQTVWPIDCRLKGNVATWSSRLRPWIPTTDWQLTGRIEASAQGSVSTHRVQLTPCQVDLTDLVAQSASYRLQEPLVRLSGTVLWEAAAETVAVPDLEVASSTVSLRAKDIQLHMGNRTQASGTAAFRGDLSRIFAMLQHSQQTPTSDVRGNLQGTIQVATREGAIAFSGTSTCADFSLLTRKSIPTITMGPQTTWAETWRESQVHLSTSGSFHPTDATLHFDQLRLSGDVAQVQARGSVRRVTAVPIADLSGEIEYDLYGIVAKMKNWIGAGIELVGRQRQTFTLHGPLSLSSVQMSQVSGAMVRSTPVAAGPLPGVVHPDLVAEAELGWDRANLYGLRFGQQKISLRLRQSVVTTTPIETQLIGGFVSLSPRLELASQPVSLVLDERTKVQSIQITPDMCDDWIKYVAPLLAGTTTAEGQFSATITTARVPLTQPNLADASGVVAIERARVQPGPIAQQLLTAFRETATLARHDAPSLSFHSAGNNWLDVQQQNVEFQMTQGRIYHRQLTLTLADVPIQTTGWVGVDQTMSVVAQIPIQESWIQKEPLLAGLRGQSIQIPIQGTLTSPQVDRRAFAQLTQQVIGSTAERYLHDELEKGLKKLLGPK